jgi:hypothetical protein
MHNEGLVVVAIERYVDQDNDQSLPFIHSLDKFVIDTKYTKIGTKGPCGLHRIRLREHELHCADRHCALSLRICQKV